MTPRQRKALRQVIGCSGWHRPTSDSEGAVLSDLMRMGYLVRRPNPKTEVLEYRCNPAAVEAAQRLGLLQED